MNRDSRGVLRGPCTACGCGSYVAGTGGLKCATCSHPPGKHQNLSSARGAHVPAAGHSATPSAGPTSGYSYSQAASGYSYDPHQQYPQATYSAGTQPHFQRQPSLPLCKASTCSNYVHYEHEVGAFDYCTPECRNSDLLSRERDRLKEDLRKLEEDLRSHAASHTYTGFGATGNTGHTYTGFGNTSTFSSTSAGNGGSAGISVRKQKTGTMYFNKRFGQDLGLHLHEEPYNANGIRGLLITGVSTGSVVYSTIKGGELKLLDIILKLNDQNVTESLTKPFADQVKDMTSLYMTVHHSISVPCSSKFLEEADKKGAAFIFVLRNPKTVHQTEFGITVSMPLQNLVVQGVSEQTVARASGLKYNDVIVLYAQATEDKMEKCITQPTEFQFKTHLKEAYKKDKSMIVAVRREKITTL